MPLYLGDKEITSVYIGDKECQQIMVGDKEIWSSNKSIFLGTGKVFNVKSIYSKWRDVSIDDFFVTATEGNLVYSTYTCYRDPQTGSCLSTPCPSFSDSVSFTKTYVDGILNCSFGGQNVSVWLIPNSQKYIDNGKIISLGTGNEFDASSLKNYQKATKNNFLCRTLNSCSSSYICCSPQCENWIAFNKSYDNETGKLVMCTSVRRVLGGTTNTSPYYIPFIKE